MVSWGVRAAVLCGVLAVTSASAGERLTCHVEPVGMVEAVAEQPETGVRYAVQDGSLMRWRADLQSYEALGARGALKDVSGLSFDPQTGALYAVRRVEGGSEVVQVNLKTGAAQQGAFGPSRHAIAVSGLDFGEFVTDLAIDPWDGEVYVAVSGGEPRLARLARTNGRLTSVASFERGVVVTALSMDSTGQLWGTAETQRHLYAIDKSTARMRKAVELEAAQSERPRALSCLCAGLDRCAMDADGDGLSNAREAVLGTHPFNKDTDRDGYSDLTETEGGRFIDLNEDDILDALQPSR